jgi:hypothetical protein
MKKAIEMNANIIQRKLNILTKTPLETKDNM